MFERISKQYGHMVFVEKNTVGHKTILLALVSHHWALKLGTYC